MRSPLVARRILVPAVGLALAAAVAGCSSSSSSPASSSTASTGASTPASSAAASSSAPAATSGADAVADITANWEKFFDSKTPVAQKVALLQDGTAFAPAISDLSQLPLASGIGAKVTGVSVTSAAQATVTYNLTAGSSNLLSGQTGTSVYQDGIWKVGDGSLCNLFKLVPGGTVPAACHNVS